jgi:hypothetical protein
MSYKACEKLKSLFDVSDVSSDVYEHLEIVVARPAQLLHTVVGVSYFIFFALPALSRLAQCCIL